MHPFFCRATHTRMAIALLLAAGLGACSPPQTGSESASTASPETQSSPAAAPSPAAELPQVVATSSVLCDLASQIAQNTIALTCLIKPGVDPHAYSPKPEDRRALEDADLVLYTGYDYEPDLIQMIQATNTPAPKIAVLEKAVPKPLMGEVHDHDHGHDKEEAHDHAHSEAEEAHAETAAEGQVPDPHVWHNPKNGAAMAEVISQQFQALIPANAAQYEQKEQAIATQLNDIYTWTKTQVETVPPNARKLVTPHNSFQYFADAFGFKVGGTIEGLSTDEQPSPARLAELVDLVKSSNVPAIFGELTTNPQLIETLARNASVKLAEQPLFVEGPGDANSAAPTYQKMLVANTCTIVNALGGKCDSATAPQ